MRSRTLSTIGPNGRAGRCSTVLVLLAVLVAGCDLSVPEYVRPDIPEKTAWQDPAAQPQHASDTIQRDWWHGFGSDYLDQLVDKAINNNIDLRVMAARINVAEAGIDVASAGGKPRVSLGAGVDVTKHTQVPGSTTQYSTAGTVDWELDIWGKFAAGTDAQQAEVKATEADWRAGYLKLVSDVASSFFRIRELDEQLMRQEQALMRNSEILTIHENRYREGLVPRTVLLQQRAEVKRLRQGKLELERQRETLENSLATLLGDPAGEHRVPPGRIMESVSLLDVPAGLPSELLNRRPDIIAAEYRAKRAVKLVGQARLARLPSLGLSARGGSASFELSTLLKAWTFGLSPSITLPMFDPNIKARIKVSEAEARVAEEEYRAVVMRAFEEVENALVTLHSRKEQHAELLARLSDLRDVAQMNRNRLRAGVISQLELFESERSVLDAEQEVLGNYHRILVDTVLLYKALGGGWPAEYDVASTKS
ncbi:MAG: efflux transporter outer membrane subunit [Gammaproteobacteria bacterium]|nr:efflux transporter outer membrane subunit [Gammaproteobacteria bacterium]